MKKLIFILLLPLYVYSQDYTSFLPEVAWRTVIDSVVYQTDNTYTVKVSPIDVNDPGALNKVIGTFLTDNKGRAYEITDSLTLSTGNRVITVVDVYRSGAAPFSGAIGYITKAPGNGNSRGLSVNYFEELDNKAIDYKRRIDNRILWEHGQTIPFDSMRLDTDYVSSGTEPAATVYWDDDNQTISFPVPDGGVIQIGQEPHDYYHNLEGAAIVNGDIVSTCGASGNRTAVCLTDATDDVKSLAAFGMVTVPVIGNNNVGRITKSGGKVRGLNTIAYAEGTELYVDPLNKGKWTATMPAAPNRAIKIGTVAVSHAVNGVVELQIQVLPKLSELADVNGTPLSESGQIPVWDNDSGYFDFDHKLWGVDTGLIQSKAYDSTWNGLDSVAPSKNAVYDKINSMDTDIATKVPKVTSTDNAIARFDGTTGNIQNSGVTISDANSIVTPSTIQATTAILTNITNNNIPYKTASGLANSIIRQTSVAIMTLKGTTTGGWYINGGNSTGTGGGYTMYQTDATNKFLVGTETSAIGGTSGGGIAYVYGDFPFKVHTNGVNRLSIDASGGTFTGFVQATTAKLTNLTDAFLPIHTSDAVGLVNSNVSQSSNILLYNSANAFSTDREIPDVGWVKSGVMAGKTSTTASTALTNTDYTVICQTGVTKLLFPASPSTGKVFVLVNHTGSAISLRNSGDTGDVSYTNYSAATVTTLAANSAIRIQYIGTTWYLIE